MRLNGFAGPAYTSSNPTADIEDCCNVYPEQIESPGGKVRAVLQPTPGQTPFVSQAGGIVDVGTRALFAMNARAFGLVGAGVYEIFNTKNVIRRGAVTQDGNPGQFAENGAAQALVASGGGASLLDLNTNTLTPVGSLVATMIGMIDGYFIAFDAPNNKFRISALLNGASWDPTQFAQRSAQPDPWKAMIVGASKDLWLIGEQSGEVWYDAGAFPFPFALYPGAVFRYGIAAPFSLALVGESPIWLSQNGDGAGLVVKAQGYSPQRISTHAVEAAIAAYARTSTISDAIGWSYQQNGHLFYVLKFPTAGFTWVYDDTTGWWHRRSTRLQAQGLDDSWHPQAHCYAFGQHLVGEATTGSINMLDDTTGLEADGQTFVRRVRRAPGLFRNHQDLSIQTLELYLETGLGLVGTGAASTVMLRQSRDGGKTWGTERWASAGAIGQYRARARWLQCGSSRDYVPEFVMTDNVPWRLTDLYANEPLERGLLN